MSSLTASRTVIVTNPSGLHLRAAVAIAKVARAFQATVELVKNHHRVDGKEVLQIITLGAESGSELILEAAGPDAEQAVAAVAQTFLENFGEEPDK